LNTLFMAKHISFITFCCMIIDMGCILVIYKHSTFLISILITRMTTLNFDLTTILFLFNRLK
ncbi:hypothetical protein, partial [Plebeiibacterium sediminum]